MRTRIGVHHGRATVGRLGTDAQFVNTAIGDDVNVGARLESLNSVLGTSILISGEAKAHLTGHYPMIRIGPFELSGRDSGTVVYAVMSEPIDERVEGDWEKAMSLFTQKKWEEARVVFGDVGSRDARFKKAADFFSRAAYRYSGLKLEHWRGQVKMGKVEDCVAP